MLYQEQKANDLLAQLAKSITRTVALQDDLVEEALVYLWQEECSHPNQTLSWYVQHCKFHLLDLLRRGRSADCWKHRELCTEWNEQVQVDDLTCAGAAVDDPVWGIMVAQDMFEALCRSLEQLDREILVLLIDGCSVRQAGRMLDLSHEAVRKRRHHIASVAIRLGIQNSSQKQVAIR